MARSGLLSDVARLIEDHAPIIWIPWNSIGQSYLQDTTRLRKQRKKVHDRLIEAGYVVARQLDNDVTVYTLITNNGTWVTYLPNGLQEHYGPFKFTYQSRQVEIMSLPVMQSDGSYVCYGSWVDPASTDLLELSYCGINYGEYISEEYLGDLPDPKVREIHPEEDE